MSDIFEKLAAPFDPEIVEWRPGSMTQDKTKAKALAYIDARDVMIRLDGAVGPASWQDRYEFHGARTVCYLSLCIDGVWITKADGAGDSDVEAEKGAISDAFKRAAVKWGIARYLYDIDSPWVRISKFKKIEEDEFPRLRALLRGEKPKSAYQARKDGGGTDYSRIEKELRSCKTLPELQDVWKRAQPTIIKWPDNWQESLAAEKDRIKADLMKEAA